MFAAIGPAIGEIDFCSLWADSIRIDDDIPDDPPAAEFERRTTIRAVRSRVDGPHRNAGGGDGGRVSGYRRSQPDARRDVAGPTARTLERATRRQGDSHAADGGGRGHSSVADPLPLPRRGERPSE